MASLPWLYFGLNTFPGLFQVRYLVLFLHPAKRRTAFVRVNIELQLLLKIWNYSRTLGMKDIWPVIYAKAGPLAVLLSLIFLIYSSGGFILPLLHIDFLEQKRRKPQSWPIGIAWGSACTTCYTTRVWDCWQSAPRSHSVGSSPYTEQSA